MKLTAQQIRAKYEKSYFLPQDMTCDWVKKECIEKAPKWCSVDLRDGNQALVEPMNLEEKLDYFRMLVEIGFKEIEVGFPAASDTEYNFIRALIEQGMIPQDVTIQVLTQAREHIIRKTFEAIKGAPHAIVHLYNSTSKFQREQVFRKGFDEIKQIAVDGAKLLADLAAEAQGDIRFEYSPESFSQTEIEYATEVCNAVLDVWQPKEDKKVIINLPSTVQVAMPHIFANQIEYLHKHLNYRNAIEISVHPHNDRGTGISDAEFGVLAGADRIEGTLFGNGERTGNVDIVTLAMNMMCHGVDPELDFSDVLSIKERYERLTRMKVHERTPYAGTLVFTAFSGSHQDAISKGMAWREEQIRQSAPETEKKGKKTAHVGDVTACAKWQVPYLPIDPKDLGREYESDVIRINSQSGKGGIAFILKQNYGISMPDKLKDDMRYLVKCASDERHRELTPQDIYQLFEDTYIRPRPVFDIPECHFKQENGITAEVTIAQESGKQIVQASGNGRLDAVSNALKAYFGVNYLLTEYEERAISQSSASKATAFVGLKKDGALYWGVGLDEDIIKSSIAALVSAVNQIIAAGRKSEAGDGRMVEIMNFIQRHYKDVTLAELAESFHFSTQYLSKYIRERSGRTFQESVKSVRLQKAGILLQDTSYSVGEVGEMVGYENAEHFIRLFKKEFGMTPMQYRKKKDE